MKTTRSITVDEARNWYESQRLGQARIATALEGELVFWKYAQQGKLANGIDVVSVPLLYDYVAPVAVSSNDNFVKRGNESPLLKMDRKASRIQKKLLISKDERGQFRSVTIAIISDNEEKSKKSQTQKDKFSGTIMAIGRNGTSFETSWKYKNGKLIDVIRPNTQSPNGRIAATFSCKVGFYTKVAQNPSGNSGGYNCVPGNDRACLPSSFLDNYGGFWVLTGEFDATCDDGTPSGVPKIRDPAGEDSAEWIVADYNGPGGSSPNYPGQDPFTPSQIDEGMPIDLSPLDAFAWEMANRIGTKIYLTGEELEFIGNSNWEMVYAFRKYVSDYNRKPDLSAFTLDINSATNEQVIAAIGKLMDDPGVPKGVTAKELGLLGLGTSQFDANLRKYFQNAKEATQRAIWRYSYAEAQEQGLSRANAFKHALFAILHARPTSFGRQLAQQLTNEHENYDNSKSPTEYPIEVQMDLWNNQEGFNIYDSNPNRQIAEFDDAVFQEVTSGLMRYVFGGILRPTF